MIKIEIEEKLFNFLTSANLSYSFHHDAESKDYILKVVLYLGDTLEINHYNYTLGFSFTWESFVRCFKEVYEEDRIFERLLYYADDNLKSTLATYGLIHLVKRYDYELV